MIGFLRFVDALICIFLLKAVFWGVAKVCTYVNRREALKHLREKEKKDASNG